MSMWACRFYLLAKELEPGRPRDGPKTSGARSRPCATMSGQSNPHIVTEPEESRDG